MKIVSPHLNARAAHQRWPGSTGVGQVMLVARVSRSGNAMPQAGDLIGELGPVKPGAPGLRLVINSVQP